MTGANHKIEYYQVEKTVTKKVESHIIVESAVSLTVNGADWLSFMCTPVDLDFLAIGFLFNEGLIDSKEEIVSTRVCPTNDNVDIWLDKSIERPDSWRRTSGCTGGVTSVQPDPSKAQESLNQGPPIFHHDPIISAGKVTSLVDELLSAQSLYRQSGGVHTSVLTDGGDTRVIAEDIGRHNTLDKIAGLCLAQDIVFDQPILLTTGRISSDMMQKAIRLNAAILISRTSPSSLSIEMAQTNGITLVGYARRNSFRVYAHPGRITQMP